MPTTIGRRSPTVREIALDDELTLFDAATGMALALNRTARAIWERADGATPVDVVVRDLASAHAVAPDQIRDDVLAALRELTEAGVVVPAS